MPYYELLIWFLTYLPECPPFLFDNLEVAVNTLQVWCAVGSQKQLKKCQRHPSRAQLTHPFVFKVQRDSYPSSLVLGFVPYLAFLVALQSPSSVF